MFFMFSDLVYIAPSGMKINLFFWLFTRKKNFFQKISYICILSGVQKERMQPSDIFVLSLSTRKILRAPEMYRPSACTPLFYNAYTLRNAGACIHSHSQNAVMVTLLYTGETFEISHQEMIKGIRRGSGNQNLNYHDTLIVPIVENTPFEEDLTERMAEV